MILFYVGMISGIIAGASGACAYYSYRVDSMANEINRLEMELERSVH